MKRGFPLHRGHLYDAMHPLPEDYRNFVLEVSKEHARVLEMGVGTGRLMIPLLEAGHSVIGIDADPEMLESAQSKLDGAQSAANARLLLKDLTKLDDCIAADVAIFSSNTLSLIETPVGRSRIFRWLARSLEPSARIVVILNNTARLIREGCHRETVHIGSFDGNMVEVSEKRSLDASKMRWVGTNRFSITTKYGSKSEYVEHVSHGAILFTEIELLAQLHGFVIDKIYGSYQFGPFTRDSLKMIAVLARDVEFA